MGTGQNWKDTIVKLIKNCGPLDLATFDPCTSSCGSDFWWLSSMSFPRTSSWLRGVTDPAEAGDLIFNATEVCSPTLGRFRYFLISKHGVFLANGQFFFSFFLVVHQATHMGISLTFTKPPLRFEGQHEKTQWISEILVNDFRNQRECTHLDVGGGPR